MRIFDYVATWLFVKLLKYFGWRTGKPMLLVNVHESAQSAPHGRPEVMH